MTVPEYAAFEFNIGTNLNVFVIHRTISSIGWRNPIIMSWSGSGAMYSSQLNFKLVTYYAGVKDSQGNWLFHDVEINGETYSVPVLGTSYNGNNQTGKWGGFEFTSDAPKFPLYIGENVTSIANQMFRNWKLNKIELNEGLVSIGSYAFGNTLDYTLDIGIKFPSTVNLINSNAFEKNPGLTEIDFSDNSLLTSSRIRSQAFQVSSGTGYTIPIDTDIILGDASIRNVNWSGMNRNPNWVTPVTAIAQYACWDPVNGTQLFNLYDTPQGSYNRVFVAEINGVFTSLFLPMVDINDTVNGGNRVQFVPGVGSFRFKR